MTSAFQDFDVLIVGSGLAGLSAALHLAPTHRVAILTKRAMSAGAPYFSSASRTARLPSSPAISPWPRASYR